MDEQQRRSVIAVELRRLSCNLPPIYRDMFTSDFIQQLTDSFLDGTVFQIVSSLLDMQDFTERKLHQNRCDLIGHMDAQRRELMSRNQPLYTTPYAGHNSATYGKPLESSELERQLTLLDERAKKELRQTDINIVKELDQQVIQQQITLEKAGVPAFHVTNCPQDIRLQMHIVDFARKVQMKLALPSN